FFFTCLGAGFLAGRPRLPLALAFGLAFHSSSSSDELLSELLDTTLEDVTLPLFFLVSSSEEEFEEESEERLLFFAILERSDPTFPNTLRVNYRKNQLAIL